MTDFPVSRKSRTTLLARGVSLMTAMVFAVGVGTPIALAAPDAAPTAAISQQQNVGWMSTETATYLGSIGMDVMVPSWLPAPFEGAAPDVYAGDGSYSLYWLGSGDVPTFLHITGVIGGVFPDGSKADLNVPLSVNASVQGWPAIQDIGIPAGSSTPIYDQVWWIADGVRYSVEGNNIGADSLTIANSMVYLQAPVVEPTFPPATEVPYVPPTEAPVYEEPAAEEPVNEAPLPTEPDTTVVDPEMTEPTAETIPSGGNEPQATTGEGANATTGSTSTGSWSPSRFDTDVPSDGTAGPRPPVIGGDGTGGLYDTSLPRIKGRP